MQHSVAEVSVEGNALREPSQQDDVEDEGAFDSLIEMLRAAEREGHSGQSRRHLHPKRIPNE